MNFDYGWYDIAGNLGVFLIIITYLLLQLRKMDSSHPAYSGLNALGAALIIVSLVNDFNLSAFIIEVFWILISLVGIVRYFSRRAKS